MGSVRRVPYPPTKDFRREAAVPTLHIQHPITDFDTWASAFNRFADARRRAGVRAQCIRRPVDDPNYVVIDLEFDSADEAAAFRRFLETQVWGTQENAPALVGSPETMILEPVATE
jgi:hypothetical protein